MQQADAVRTRIKHRVRLLLKTAQPLVESHGATAPDPLIRFDLRGQAAGQARWQRTGRPVLRFNLDIARRHEADFLATTVTHEVAHLVTAACHGRTRPHGPEWRAVMTYLGIPDAQRCHQYPVEHDRVRRQRRWSYRCDCGEHQLSTTRHRRLQSGSHSYLCRRCATVLRPAD